MTHAARRALADAAPEVFWLDRVDAPPPTPALVGTTTADLVIVGGGFTGLWAALQAKDAAPERDVVVLESGAVGIGASGRNGGFVSASITHGLANGLAHFPDELVTLHRLGNENFDALVADLGRYDIDAGFEATGELSVATAPWQLETVTEHAALARRFGEDVRVLDADELRAEVASPTYVGGLWQKGHVGLVDPARLVWGLKQAALGSGVRIHEHSPVTALDRVDGARAPIAGASGVGLRGPHFHVRADRVLLATNAFRGLVPAIRRSVLPVYDYVLVTEPLSADELGSIGWAGRQGIGDAANQFHYYRRTADDRILWGGYDAIYHYGNRVGAELEQRESTEQTLAGHFFDTFPQLEGVRFTHRWGGPIATTTRFMLTAGTAHGGRVAYAVGYTGLGVGASRFGARVALDLLAGQPTELTELGAIRRRPVPFPPEPLRWVGVELTRRAIAAADRNEGRRGAWLRLLDRFGVGFDS